MDRDTQPVALKQTRPLLGMAGHLRLALIVLAISNLILFASYIASAVAYDPAVALYEPGAINEIVRETIMWTLFFSLLGSMLGLVWTALVLVRWVYRAARNLGLQGEGGTTLPVLDSIALFFPGPGLVFPLLTFRRLWRASWALTGNPAKRPPLIILIWWVCWALGSSLIVFTVLSGLTGWLVLAQAMEVLANAYLDSIFLVLFPIAAFCLDRTVFLISRLQDEYNTKGLVEVFS